jgi:Transposase IS200 like.
MPQSLTQIYLHIVFSTKNREPFLDDPLLRQNMHQYLGGACRQMDCPAVTIGGVADHVHILLRLGRMITVAELIKELKQQSSKWIKSKDVGVRDFHWQNGYAGFSASPGHLDRLGVYIDNQEEHHRTESYQDELRRLFRKYGLEWDERYVWD